MESSPRKGCGVHNPVPRSTLRDGGLERSKQYIPAMITITVERGYFCFQIPFGGYDMAFYKSRLFDRGRSGGVSGCCMTMLGCDTSPS